MELASAQSFAWRVGYTYNSATEVSNFRPLNTVLGADGDLNDKQRAVFSNSIKVLSYIPIISLVASLVFAGFVVRVIDPKPNLRHLSSSERKQIAVAFIIRSVFSAIGIGVLFFPVDVIGTLIKGCVDHVAKRKARRASASEM